MEKRITIVTICGSVRPGNYAAKALALVLDALGKQPKVKVIPIDLDAFDLPLEHLRSVCSHVGAIVLPNLVSVARVKEIFDEQGRCLDGRMEKLIRNLATSLLDYIEGAICPRIALEAIVRGEAEAEEIL